MTAKHTPGPWSIHWGTAQSGSGHHIVDSSDMGELSRIATVLFHDDTDGETAANAHLVAAAPDLLEALQSAHEVLLVSYPLHSIDMDRRGAILEQARAAIAKATGETK